MKILVKVWHIVEFAFFYLHRFISSNIEVAYEILTPDFGMHPAIIEVPVIVKSDHEILALVNLITMTPGTLSLDISDDKEKLYVHAMYAEDKDKFISDIKKLERKIQKLLN
ncbi:Na+/H+ antiporter subunit E [Fulvivirga ulvae]|uniref:Na+/H+ antiporter subunit E n=1 Tax=Fulvivirga ulvae TaxID=2904245 RepID=UPI001F24BDA1|nr:Na+/H+ antiporter subunit E [Fulvivirga ulvae]UII30591.1 Na+/H+ antiporter subunit E [Fulvivirga ulvae]